VGDLIFWNETSDWEISSNLRSYLIVSRYNGDCSYIREKYFLKSIKNNKSTILSSSNINRSNNLRRSIWIFKFSSDVNPRYLFLMQYDPTLQTHTAVRLIILQSQQPSYKHNIKLAASLQRNNETVRYHIFTHSHKGRPTQRWTRIKSSGGFKKRTQMRHRVLQPHLRHGTGDTEARDSPWWRTLRPPVTLYHAMC